MCGRLWEGRGADIVDIWGDEGSKEGSKGDYAKGGYLESMRPLPAFAS